jgi:hypothetical protein
MRSTRVTILPRLAGAAALAALVTGVASAEAAPQTKPIADCPPETLVQPFLPWHDQSSYFLAPAGDFESTPAGWTLTGGAASVPGNETAHVNAASDASSLGLPSGSSATSAQICVTIHSPNVRLFAINGGSSRSMLQVTLNYTDKRGAARTAVVGTLRAGSSWSLTPQIMFLSRIAPAVGGHGQTWVSFTFKPTTGGAWQVDDFYVDPIKSQ